MTYKIEYKGQIKKDNWDCFSWFATINGVSFEYYTGLGHSTKSVSFYYNSKPQHLKESGKKTIKDGNLFVHVPKVRDLLHSLATDASCAQDSFDWFCANMGYDTDSRKALDTYLSCQESGHKLRRMGYDMNRILDWGL